MEKIKKNSLGYLKLLCAAWCLILGLNSCNLENNIDLNLPEYESQLVVECYLEPGKQAHLLLTESSPYLDSFSLPFVSDVVVTISYNNITDTLMLNPQVDEEQRKFYNFISNKIVPEDYENEFILNVKDAKGRTVTGKTKLLKPVLIQELEYKFNKDSLAFLLVSFSDEKSEKNYYRFLVNRESMKDSINDVVQEFAFTDDIAETSKISVGTAFNFKKGENARATLYHINKEYHDYIQTTGSARDANFNPFAQPSMVKSNVKGGIGIFTGLSYDMKAVMIE